MPTITVRFTDDFPGRVPTLQVLRTHAMALTMTSERPGGGPTFTGGSDRNKHPETAEDVEAAIRVILNQDGEAITIITTAGDLYVLPRHHLPGFKIETTE